MPASSFSEPYGNSRPRLRLSRRERLALAVRIAYAYLAVVTLLQRKLPLPDVLVRLAGGRRSRRRYPPDWLGALIHARLRLGNRTPRCLVSALVLVRILREQGDRSELLIGLPESPVDKDAHAWVEVDGRDVGPIPRRGHDVLARYEA